MQLKIREKQLIIRRALRWASQNAKVPIFITQIDVGPDMATGTLLIDGVKHGMFAASIVDKVLQKQKVRTLSEDPSAKYLFSQSQLDRFNLKIPETIRRDSEIVE